MTIATPRVDPRVKRTRKLLERAFFELLAERGFQAITVQNIAERAEVNRATFYAHFDDKFALADSLIRAQFRETLAGALPAGAAFTLDNLQLLARAVCEYLATMQDAQCRPGDHAQFQPLLEAAVPEELHAFIATWLRQMPRAGGRPELSPAMAATVMSWAIFGAGARWSRGAREQAADVVARQVVAALTDGVPRALGLARHLG